MDQVSLAAWAAIAGLAILSTALGFLFIGEQLEPGHFAGVGLIALGLAAIDGRLLALRRPGVRTY